MNEFMKKMVALISIFCMILFSIPYGQAEAAEAEANAKPKVIPSLLEWTGGTGSFNLTDQSRIVITSEQCICNLQSAALLLQEDLKEVTGKEFPVVIAKNASKGDILLAMHKQADDSIGDEGYYFEVGDYVTIRANTYTGVYYGTRTALQILEQDLQKSSIVKGIAKDYPQYKERGFMLDVGRKFIPMNDLKEYVKFMSYYKMNDFQIHLNDNAIFSDTNRSHWNDYSAFRLENTKYPELTAKDGHYTKQEFRELQDLAKARGIKITPEIDTPSHSLALTKVRPDLTKDSLPVDHLDISRPEAVEFIKDVWDEYLDNDWFDSNEIHFGADEFDRSDRSTYEIYRQFLNVMNEHFKSKGKTARMWGSLKMFPGTTEVDKDIIVHAWSNGWQDPVESINQGYKVINTLDSYLYMVPKAGYYRDYLDTQWLFNNWDPTYFGANLKVREGEPNLLGGMFALWNDMLGKKVSLPDVHDRVMSALPVMAHKLWRGSAANDISYAEFQQLSRALGEGAGSNLSYKVDTASELIVHYPFDEGSSNTAADQSGNDYHGRLNGVAWIEEGKSGSAAVFGGGGDHIATGLTAKGLPWTVTAWVKLDEEQADKAIFMESGYGALLLKQENSDKAGFTREGYDFTFNAAIPAGRWVHVAFQGDLSGTALYIDGELKSKVTESTLLPAATIGGAANSFAGALDEFKIFDRKLTSKEIAAEAGSPPWTINIAAHKPAVASSIEVSQFPPELAFDEDESSGSRWSSKYTDNEWIYVDLGDSYNIGKVILKWESAFAKGYKIQISDDAADWRDVYTTNAGVGGTEIIKFPAENGRYVRMLGTKRSGTYGYSLYEFEVYEANPNDPVPERIPVRYWQDFEDNSLAGWEHVVGVGVGSMSIVEAPGGASQYAARFAANNVNNLFIDQNSPLIKDGEIEFKVTPQTDTIRTGIIFRYVDNDAWASVGFDQGSWYWVNAQDNYGAMTNNQGARLRKGETATVKVKFEGSHVTLIVNGTTYFEGALPRLPVEEGKMGARVFGPATAIYDDFYYANNVADVPATGIQLNLESLELQPGETAELIATVMPQNATNKQVTWASSDPGVAKVEIADGKAIVTAVQPGEADIIATTVSGGYTAVSKVTVQPVVANEPSTTLTGPSSVQAEGQFDVTLQLQHPVQAVYAMDYMIEYDASLMEFVSAESLVEGAGLLETKAGEGKVRLIMASRGADHAVVNDSDIVKLTFKAKPSDQPATGSIRVLDAVLGHGDGSEVKAAASALQIEILIPTPGLPGDVNQDGKVSIGDLAIVAANYGKTSADADWEQVKHLDVKADGRIDIEDLVFIARIMFGD